MKDIKVQVVYLIKSFRLEIQLMIESGLGIKTWTHQGKIDNRVLSPELPIINGLEIMKVILTW